MSQPLDFSNQDLRNRSFKGRDLAGADFRKADIRGCDFSNANLESADFSGVIAGRSGKQISRVVAFEVTGVVSCWFGAALFQASGSWVVFLVVFLSGTAFEFVGISSFAFIGGWVGALAGTEFIKGNIVGGIGYVLGSLLLLYLSHYFLIQEIEKIRNATGTSFKGATLIKSKFIGAILKNCDFTDARLAEADWAHTDFIRCKFSDNLNDQWAREK